MILLFHLYSYLKHLREYRKNLNELSSLSERELNDIGLNRSDIHRVAWGDYNRT